MRLSLKRTTGAEAFASEFPSLTYLLLEFVFLYGWPKAGHGLNMLSGDRATMRLICLAVNTNCDGRVRFFIKVTYPTGQEAHECRQLYGCLGLQKHEMQGCSSVHETA